MNVLCSPGKGGIRPWWPRIVSARRQAIDDVGYLAALVEHLLDRHGLHATDVLVAGYSNGAHMALRLALERPDLVGALGMVAAQLPADTETDCAPGYPSLHLLHIAGTKDPFVPFGGGPSVGPDGESLGLVQSAEATVQAFVQSARGAAGTRKTLPERDGNPVTSASEYE